MLKLRGGIMNWYVYQQTHRWASWVVHGVIGCSVAFMAWLVGCNIWWSGFLVLFTIEATQLEIFLRGYDWVDGIMDMVCGMIGVLVMWRVTCMI